MFKYIMLSSLFMISVNAANTGLNAASLKLKVYKFAVSTSSLCTNLVTVIDNGSSPTEVDFVGSVNLGSGTVTDGTYPCVVIEFSDNIKYTPSSNSTAGNCSTSTEYTSDVCRASSTSALIDGTTTTCDSSANKVAMYITTASSASSSSDAFNPPTTIGDTTKGFNLGSALTISGTSSGKFVVNPNGKVCDTDAAAGACDGETDANLNTCRMEPPTFSFTEI